MALSAQTISAAIQAASLLPGSQVLPWLAQAVAQAIVSWASIPTNLLVQGVTTGFVGAGSVSGTLQFVSAQQMSAAFAGLGASSALVAQTLQNGLSTGLNGAQYSGISAAVGTGSDISKVSLANSATLYAALQGQFQGQSIRGISAPLLAAAIAQGVAAIFLTGFGFGSVTGAAGAAPAAGTSTSIVF